MAAKFSERDDVLIVEPPQRLDTATAPGVEKEVFERMEAGATKIVFDFNNTEYISSAGLRVMLKAAKSVGPNGGVAVCRMNSHVKDVLKLSGFEMLLKVARSVDKAVATL